VRRKSGVICDEAANNGGREKGGGRVENGRESSVSAFFAVLPPVKTGGYKMIDVLSSFFGLLIMYRKCTRL